MGEKKEKKERKEKREKKEKKRHRDSDDEGKETKEAKKAMKKAAKAAKMLGYTNETNPFGDSDLLKPFVWGKKVEKEKKEGREGVHDSESLRLKTMNEIESVRKRREEREQQIAEQDRIRAEQYAEKESAQFGDWKDKEEDFMRNQTKDRSKIRIAEGRPRSVDLLAKNIILVDAALANFEEERNLGCTLMGQKVETRTPLEIIDSTTSIGDLKELRDDVTAYIELESGSSKGKSSNPDHVKFWRKIEVIVSKALTDLRGDEVADDEAASLHHSTTAEMKNVMQSKDMQELLKMRTDIESKIAGGDSDDGMSYWKAILPEVTDQVARRQALEFHDIFLESARSVMASIKSENIDDVGDGEKEKGGEKGDLAERVRPLVMDGHIGEEEGMAATGSDNGNEDGDKVEGMKEGSEVSLASKRFYHWQDKYRPRKPRYINKVRTGWDWNKYNQTHYDKDNPPPRTIQGYKFTLFYPDLIDKTATPQYFLEYPPGKDKRNADFVILRFHVPGGPYEDVAFQILNREWDTNKKSGFRCVFNKGQLDLHFNFKRLFYRR